LGKLLPQRGIVGLSCCLGICQPGEPDQEMSNGDLWVASRNRFLSRQFQNYIYRFTEHEVALSRLA
jgi:hypothetical protein